MGYIPLSGPSSQIICLSAIVKAPAALKESKLPTRRSLGGAFERALI
jgi:hypothetical protein